MLLFNLRTTLLSIVSLCLFLSTTHAYKYLAVLHTAAKSHYIVGSALMKALAKKGHEVTVISPFPLKKPMKNFYDIETPAAFKVMEPEIKDLLNTRSRSIVENIINFHDVGLRVTEAVLTEPSVQQLLSSNQTFDVVICEAFLSEALYGLAEHFNAPLIGLGTFGAIAWNTDMVGSPSPPSYVPSAMLHFTDHMTLTERVGNLAYLTFERILLDFWYLPQQEALYAKYFPNAKSTLHDIRRNTALVLLNQHVSLSNPRPYMPNQIEVGGMHINRQRQPLPADIQQFIDGAKHGVIYFSMGSNLKSKDLPLEKRAELLDTFRGLKQRVLWKFEESNLADKPENVFISDWFPQDDILAHPNVRAFITHGGLLSTTESIYHGKPFIGIPIFGDQFLNMARAEQNGYGIMVDYTKLSKATFAAAIERILREDSYRQQVQDMSARYHDQPMEPLALATHWVEHVARHKGAKYLHCAGQDLNFWQYHNIDAMLILYGGLATMLFLLLVVIRCFWGLLQSLCAKKEKMTVTVKAKAKAKKH